MYGDLVNVQVRVGDTVNDDVSPADAELTMYLGKTCDFINDSLKGVVSVPKTIDTYEEVQSLGIEPSEIYTLPLA